MASTPPLPRASRNVFRQRPRRRLQRTSMLTQVHRLESDTPGPRICRRNDRTRRKREKSLPVRKRPIFVPLSPTSASLSFLPLPQGVDHHRAPSRSRSERRERVEGGKTRLLRLLGAANRCLDLRRAHGFVFCEEAL